MILKQFFWFIMLPGRGTFSSADNRLGYPACEPFERILERDDQSPSGDTTACPRETACHFHVSSSAKDKEMLLHCD